MVHSETDFRYQEGAVFASLLRRYVRLRSWTKFLTNNTKTRVLNKAFSVGVFYLLSSQGKYNTLLRLYKWIVYGLTHSSTRFKIRGCSLLANCGEFQFPCALWWIVFASVCGLDLTHVTRHCVPRWRSVTNENRQTLARNGLVSSEVPYQWLPASPIAAAQ